MSHDTFIKTPKQLIIAVALAFLVPIIVIVLLASWVTGGLHKEQAASASMTPKAIAERIAPVAKVEYKDPKAPKVYLAGDKVYKEVCAACHDGGVGGAPKFGDKAGWEPRLKAGFEALVASVIKGKGAMAAKGGNPDLDEFEVARAVHYMTGASGGTFAEPKVPAPTAPAAPAPTAAAAPPAPVPSAAPVVTEAPAAAPAVVAAVAAAPAATANEVGKKIYSTVCMACHDSGAGGAPKLTDKAEWAKRTGQGVDVLTATVIKGKGAMPSKGLAMSASDADIKATVEYILSQVK